MTTHRKISNSSRLAGGCVAVFALPFAAVGLLLLGLAISDVWESIRMRSWVETPARVLETRLSETRGDSTTYRVEAQYEYTFQGNRYVGTRVAINSTSDNVGSFHQDAYAELRRARDQNLRVPAFVNPAQPHQAVLYRQMRWGLFAMKLLGGAVFGGAGLWLLIGAQIGKRRHREEENRRLMHPDQPWRWREEWRDGRIPGSASRGAMLFVWMFAGIWNAISAPLPFLIAGDVARGNKAALIGLLFPVVGAGLLVWAIRSTLRWRRFGRSALVMQRVPAKLGGEVRVAVETRAPIDAPQGITVSLSCIERVTARRRGEDNSSERILYQDRKQLPTSEIVATTDGWRLPIRFMLPVDQPQTDLSAGDRQVVWRIDVDAAMPGVDFHDQFEIPVFGHAHPSQSKADAPPSRKTKPAIAEMQALLSAQGIELGTASDGAPTLHLRRARHRGVTLGAGAFTLIWFGAIAFMLMHGAPLWFSAIFMLFGLLIAYITLDLLLDRATITLQPDAIELRRGWFGAGKLRRFERGSIRSLQITRGMQAGNRLYHDIKIETIGSRPVALARSIGDLETAERIKGWLEHPR